MWKKIVKKIRKTEEIPSKKIKYSPDSVFPSKEIQNKVEEYLTKKRA